MDRFGSGAGRKMGKSYEAPRCYTDCNKRKILVTFHLVRFLDSISIRG